MTKLVRRRVILAKVETTYNTDPTPTGADNAILIEELNWQPEGLRMVERPAIRSSLGSLQHIYGGSLLGVSFRCEVKGSGAAGTPPEISPLLLGSSLAETIVPATSVTYKPASGVQSSITLYVYEDGTLTILTGCRGTLDWSGEVGGRLMADFTFQGHFAGPTDVALPTPVYDTTVPPILINAAFSVGGYGAVINAISFSMGNTLGVPPNLIAADGYGEILVTGRDVNGSFDPEQTLVATNDFMADFKAGTTMALDSGTFGTVAGNRVNFTMPALYYRNISNGDREGVLSYDIPFGAAESTTDDEVSIIFT